MPSHESLVQAFGVGGVKWYGGVIGLQIEDLQ